MMRIQGTGSDTGDDIVSKSKTDLFWISKISSYTLQRVKYEARQKIMELKFIELGRRELASKIFSSETNDDWKLSLKINNSQQISGNPISNGAMHFLKSKSSDFDILDLEHSDFQNCMSPIEKRFFNYLKYSFKNVGCISISVCKAFPQLIAACIWLINIRIIAVEESVFEQNSEIQLYHGNHWKSRYMHLYKHFYRHLYK